MKNGLNSSIDNLGAAIAALVGKGMESGDPDHEETAINLVKAYRDLCESFAEENLATQASPDVLETADGLANEITMAAAMQPEIGIEPMLEALTDAMDLPVVGLKRVVREMSINMAALAAASMFFAPGEFEQICSGVIQEKLSGGSPGDEL